MHEGGGVPQVDKYHLPYQTESMPEAVVVYIVTKAL